MEVSVPALVFQLRAVQGSPHSEGCALFGGNGVLRDLGGGWAKFEAFSGSDCKMLSLSATD